MISVMTNINGYQTPIEFETDAVHTLSPLKVSGDKASYRIEYGKGLVEVGGIKEIEASSVKDGVIEGVATVDTGLQIINAQATAMNVATSPTDVTGENVFIHVEDGQLKLYATANATTAQTIAVMWSVKGVVNGY